MKNIIIGTAGHIDHGKTSLIKSLTGFDTDRLKEEKERGITIDLGFSFFKLPDGQKVGIIDVPGHEKFLNNMLSGIVGMDLILFVVAGDEGVMPQTIEHLNILNLTGIEKGIIVITKKDLVDDEMMELVIDDIKDNFADTFLEDAPVLMISSKTGEGINELKKIIVELSREIKPRDENKPARMPIDRIFTLKGIGTVITGTLIEGKIEINDELYIYPQKISTRVRNIQVHGENVNFVYAGQRAAINLAASSKRDISRGDLIAEKESINVSKLLDVELINLKDSARIIKSSSRLHFFVGTKETMATVVLIDKKELNPGDKCFAQIRLTEELSVKYGDKFIVRFFSPLETIGGGTIIDPLPLVKKSSKYQNSNILKSKLDSNIGNVMLEFIKERPVYMDKNEIYKIFSVEHLEIDKITEELIENNKIIYFNDNDKILVIEISKFNSIKNSLLSIITDFHTSFNLKPGINKETLFNNMSLNISPSLFTKILKKLELENLISINNEFVKIKDFQMKLNESQIIIYGKINQLLENEDKIIKKDDLTDLDKNNVILDFMNFNKEIIIINNEYIIKNIQMDYFKNLIFETINNKDSVTVADARDLFNTSRKKTLALMEYLDYIKFTKRIEDKRVLY